MLRRPLASDLVSYGLALKIRGKLAAISNFVQNADDTTGNARLATDAIWDLARELERYIENEQDEQARSQREDSK